MIRIAVAAALLASPAGAAIYDVNLAKFGETPEPPGWVETNAAGDVVDAFFEVDGTVYDVPHKAIVGELQGTTYLYNYIAPGPLGPTPITVLQFDISGSATFNLRWAFSSCTDPAPCGGGAFAGTYRIEERAASVIPLPAAGWLLAAALGLLGLRRLRS